MSESSEKLPFLVRDIMDLCDELEHSALWLDSSICKTSLEDKIVRAKNVWLELRKLNSYIVRGK